MKTRHIAAALLLTFVPVTVSPRVWAQDDPATVHARARFKEGVEAFDRGRYEEARLSFLQAYTLKKHPAVLLNLAQSSAKSNHPLEAAKYFQQYLKEATTATPQQRKDAENGLAEVRQKLGRIEVIAPAGTEISLDDQGKVGTTPIEPIDVEPGSHTLKSPNQTVTVIAVVGQKVDAKFGAQAAPPAVAPVPVPAPAPTTAPPPAAPPPEVTPATAPPAPEAPRVKRTNLLAPPESMTPVYIGLTAGGIGLVGAIVFAAFKADAQSNADTVANNIRAYAISKGAPTKGACGNASLLAEPSLSNACAVLKDNQDKVDTNATIANVSLVVMGVGLGLAGIWYLAGPKKEEVHLPSAKAPQRPVLTPWAGVNTGGLTLSGQF